MATRRFTALGLLVAALVLGYGRTAAAAPWDSVSLAVAVLAALTMAVLARRRCGRCRRDLGVVLVGSVCAFAFGMGIDPATFGVGDGFRIVAWLVLVMATLLTATEPPQEHLGPGGIRSPRGG